MTKPDEYQRITIGYKEDTKRLGTGAATEQWCKTLFDAWMYSLDSETDRTSDETKRRLTALMRGNLNVRDALVASIIDPTLDVDAMLAIAVRPDDKSAKNYLSTLLSTTLDDATNGKARGATDGSTRPSTCFPPWPKRPRNGSPLSRSPSSRTCLGWPEPETPQSSHCGH